MDAVKFLKERKRMCRTCKTCKNCELNTKHCCSEATEAQMIEAIEIVEKWSKEHPAKTRMSEFLKQYPNANLTDEGVPNVLPCELDRRFLTSGNCSKMSCTDCYVQYWLEEIE